MALEVKAESFSKAVELRGRHWSACAVEVLPTVHSYSVKSLIRWVNLSIEELRRYMHALKVDGCYPGLIQV